jgi:hypothetical protein
VFSELASSSPQQDSYPRHNLPIDIQYFFSKGVRNTEQSYPIDTHKGDDAYPELPPGIARHPPEHASQATKQEQTDVHLAFNSLYILTG